VKAVSLKRRFFSHSALTLFGLMSLCAIAVYASFLKQIKENSQEQLKLHIYNILSVAQFEDSNIYLPDILHNPEFNSPDSGLWAAVLDQTKVTYWHSLSIDHGVHDLAVPEQSGVWLAGEVTDKGNTYLTMAYKVIWESSGSQYEYFFVIGELESKSIGEIKGLTFWLVLGFGSISLVLLIGQFLVLRFAFRPIDVMADEITRLEKGDLEKLSKSYPQELLGVGRNINALISKEHGLRQRYRDGMANLAHSLKTPMTIISNELQHYQDNSTLNNAINKVNDSIEYQLRRAVISGHTVLSSGVKIADLTDITIDAVSKIYQERNISMDKDVDFSLEFYGDENDFIEVLGNLIDNAFKHANSRVAVRVMRQSLGMSVVVEDDGAGIDEKNYEKIFNRGERLDQRQEGQGIGLSIVDDIVSSYGGTIHLSRSKLGGACFTVTFKNREG